MYFVVRWMGRKNCRQASAKQSDHNHRFLKDTVHRDACECSSKLHFLDIRKP